MLEGTLHGRWPHTGVWACLLSLVDHHGELDKHPRLIASAIGIPLPLLLECIKDFCAPDPESRSSENEGRRLTPLDTREWGWRVVNIQKYRNKASAKAEILDGRNAAKVRKYKAKLKQTPGDTGGHRKTRTHTHTHTHTKDKEAQALIPGLDLPSWTRWSDYRQQSGKPLKPASVPSAQRKLAKFGELQAEVVENSIAEGYTGLWPIKTNGHAGKVSEWE